MFECSQCGLCCRNTGKVVADAKKALSEGSKSVLTRITSEFPFGAKENGSCEKLGEDGRCTVYENRPDICNVEKSFETVGAGMTKEQYYSLQGTCCNVMIKEAGMDEKYLVKQNY